MDKLSIVFHNVLTWTFHRRNELCNYYRTLDPDIILLNSTGLKHSDTIKIFGYNVYHCNKSNEPQSGIAIAVKTSIVHQLIDDFQEDVLSVRIRTTRGNIEIATTYLPPRRPIFPVEDILKIARKPYPTYILADLNATHRALGHHRDNPRGISLVNLINRNLLTHLGPNFPTYFSRNATIPDLVLTNRHPSFQLYNGAR